MNRGLEAAINPIEAVIAPLRTAAEHDGLWRPVEHPANHDLIQQGTVGRVVFVLLEGLVKLAYATPDGGERIKSLIVDRGVFGVQPATESPYFGRTLERSTVVGLPQDWLLARSRCDAALQSALATFESLLRLRKQAREQALLCDTAEGRYRLLLAHEGGLAQRLTQADIARYIGVTPIAFSRIKRRVNAR